MCHSHQGRFRQQVMLQQRGLDCVCRLGKRTVDFRRGIRLGPDDHIVTWHRPTKPRTMDLKNYRLFPESLIIRECRVQIRQPGFRVKTLVLATTLLNAEEFSSEDLAQLYLARWNAELDLRSIKTTLQMDILRCKTPELVRKEIWTHILAYNLIRTIMAQAAINIRFCPEPSASKARCRLWKPFNRGLHLGSISALLTEQNFTNTCSRPSPSIAWPIDPIGLNHAKRNADQRNTTA